MDRNKLLSWVLALCAGVMALAASLGLLRHYAPGLLGMPADLVLVRSSKEVPPFYENAFGRVGVEVDSALLLKDPLTRIRALPLAENRGGWGPNDLLGFRNHAVPNQADIIVIGDSQTYGNNAVLEDNWPSHMQRALVQDGIGVYNMATGGWSALQYLYIFDKALQLKPRYVVVAFYSGNDPAEAFMLAYASHYWSQFQPDAALDAASYPGRQVPAADDVLEWVFSNGEKAIFTPALRYVSVQDHAAVDAGWQIMQNVARHIGDEAARHRVPVLFTIIPTKELVYAPRIAQSGQPVPDLYAGLVRMEAQRIDRFAEGLKREGFRYIDVVSSLQQAAGQGQPLYAADPNGHPLADGYRVIGERIAQALRKPFLKGLAWWPGQHGQSRLVWLDGEHWGLVTDDAVSLQPHELPVLVLGDAQLSALTQGSGRTMDAVRQAGLFD